MKVNVGCGSTPIDGWLNIDAYRESPHHRHRTDPDVLADAHTLPLETASVEHARLRHVLEHLERPLDALRECARVLEPGGTAYIEVPNPAVLAPERREHHSEHLYSWTAGSLERICRRAGFGAVEYDARHPDSQPRGHAVVATKPSRRDGFEDDAGGQSVR